MRIPHAVTVPVLLAAVAVAQKQSWPYSMDYGPTLTTTLEAGGVAGTCDKALVIRLGDRGAVAFDTELLRLTSSWTDGWLKLRGTAYDGAHGPMSARHGDALIETAAAPGWAHDGQLSDPRAIPHGPLPRSWGRFGGHTLVGDDVVIDYRVGDMNVRERFALEGDAPARLVRTLELGPSKHAQQMVVLDGPSGAAPFPTYGRENFAMLKWTEEAKRVSVFATNADWTALPMGAPSEKDYLDVAAGNRATVQWVPGFASPHGSRDGEAELRKLRDGEAARNDDDTARSVWFDSTERDGRNSDHGRFHVDLREPLPVTRVNTFSWHRDDRAAQKYVLYGSVADTPDTGAADPQDAGWTLIAEVDTTGLVNGDKHGVGVYGKPAIGRFRHLLFDVSRGRTFFSEVDVYAGDVQAQLEGRGFPSYTFACQLHGSAGPQIEADGARVLMKVPPHDEALRVQLVMTRCRNQFFAAGMEALVAAREVAAIPSGEARTRWGDALVTEGAVGADDGPFAVDTITIPFDNPYGSRMRTGAFDFFSDGRAAVSTWNGDVWVVSGIDEDLDRLEWKRFATGLYDPLGLRIVDDVVFVHGRDGLTRLIDSDGDGEADRYECFNNDIFITPAFHEFAFDLQTDGDGNFYFSKGAPVNPGGRGFMKIAPHHGTILKVGRDGSTIETIATGMRAPNGICVSPDGVVTSGDNEGTYMPRCRLNWIEKPGFYAGVKDTAHRTPVPDQPDLPLCWMPMEIDNSSGNQVWVPEGAWGQLQGRLLHNSYGTCSTYLVLPERVNGQMQGGVVRLPVDYSSSAMRGRFSPKDGHLYVVGLKGWQTKAAREGGFHRVRRTAAPLAMPIALRTCDKGVYLTFSDEVDAESAGDPEAYSVEIWNYLYSPNYGSPELSVLEPDRKVAQGEKNRDPLAVTAATVGPDKRTVFLAVDGMRPVHQMRITWDVDSAAGELMRGELHNSIHALAEDPGFPEGK